MKTFRTISAAPIWGAAFGALAASLSSAARAQDPGVPVGNLPSATQSVPLGGVDAPSTASGAPVARGGTLLPITQMELTADVRADSNVVPFSDNVNSRLRSRSDQRFSPGVNVQVQRQFGRSSIALNGAAGYDFYNHNHVLNSERLLLSAAATTRFSRCEAEFTPSITRQQSSLYSIVPITAPNARSSIRNIETIQSYAGDASCGGTYGFRPTLTASHSSGSNSNDFRRISNYNDNSYGGGLGYRSPVLGEWRLIYTRDVNEYPDRPRAFGNYGFTSDKFTLSAQREMGAVIRASAAVSYLDLRPKGAGVPGFRGVSGNVGVTVTPSSMLQLRFNLLRDVGPALYSDASYVKTTGASVAVDYFASSRLSVHADANYRKRDYAGAGTLLGAQLSRDVFTSFSGGPTYRLGRRLRVTLTGGVDIRRGNGTLFDYTDKWVALTTGFKL